MGFGANAALDSRATLEERINAMEMKYAGRTIPRPEHWHGWRVIPKRMEFWHQRDFRLHDRFEYVRNEADASGSWQAQRLNP
jgi:pyridoxamine 5'-phosphate oxidase